MILTKELIQDYIPTLNWMIAKKTIKYACGLAIGKDNSCLLNEIKLLKVYKSILKAFKIVGTINECDCTIVDNDFEFNEISISTGNDSKIQFLSNGTGTLVNPSGTYSFTWSYLNEQLFIQLPNDNVIVYSGINFGGDCNFSFQTQENGFSFLATIDAPTDAQVYDGAYGVMAVFKPDGTTVLKYTNYIPSNPSGIPAQEIIQAAQDTSQKVADYWNEQHPESNLFLEYRHISEVFNMWVPYYNNYDYTDHILKYYYCSDNGNPSFTTFVNPITQGWVNNYTPAYGNITVLNNQFFEGIPAEMEFLITEAAMFNNGSTSQSFAYEGTVMFTHSGTYSNMGELVSSFNNNNGLGFVMEIVSGFTVKIIAPNNYPQVNYNSDSITIQYFGASFEDDGGTFSGGVNQTSSHIVIQDGLNGIVYELTAPYNITSVAELIADFNENNTAELTATLISNSGTQSVIKITAPNNTGYIYNNISLDYLYYSTGYEFNSTYQYGVDPTTGKFIVTGTSPSTVYYEDLTSVNYTNISEFVTAFNASTTNQGFTAELVGSKNVKFTAPFESGTEYDGELIYLIYNYDSSQYTDVNIDQELDGGVDPTFLTLTGDFNPSGLESSSFTNMNPCDHSEVTQICLSNDQIIKILNYITKLNNK